MNEMKDEWSASEVFNFSGTWVVHIHCGDTQIAQTRSDDDKFTKEEAQQIGNTIASVPVILESLKEMVGLVRCSTRDEHYQLEKALTLLEDLT